jgi:lipopolysaccharide/colanic/teichoic acid biosynthesis glycosyltransferase
MQGHPMLNGIATDVELSRLEYPAPRRLIDPALACVLLVVLLPFLIVIAVAIALDSPGPVLFVQPRVGYSSQVFQMFKFRTMKRDRRSGQVPISFPDRRRSLKVKNDPRITRVGRFLRRTSLDELPQLINIVRGEMTFVGPRPELPDLVAHYSPRHFLRHMLLPGVTGWWQIRGRCTRPDGCPVSEDLATKLADDMYYLEHRSMLFDAKILLLTLPVVLRGRGGK